MSLSAVGFGPAVHGQENLAATGTDQATAYQIVAQESVFTTVASGTGCRLPWASGATISVYNLGANDLSVYPGSGDQIGSGSVNAAVTVASGDSAAFTSLAAPTSAIPRRWYQQASSGGGSAITSLTGDVTAAGPGAAAATLATVNTDVGSFTNANITVDGKGRVTSAADGSGGLLSLTVSLSSAQILAAAVTPVTVVPAPGAGKATIVFKTVYQLLFGTTPYTGGPGALYYAPDASSSSAAALDLGDNQIFLFTTNSVGTSTGNQSDWLFTSAENQDVVYAVNTPAGNAPYVGGDGTGSITVFYEVVTL